LNGFLEEVTLNIVIYIKNKKKRGTLTLTTKFKQYLEEIFDKVPTGGGRTIK